MAFPSMFLALVLGLILGLAGGDGVPRDIA
jgi:hypothetical protein